MNDKERILIVDDDENVCRSLSLIFAQKGYEAEAARTGREALEKARDQFYNLALVDVRLPDTLGVELLGPLREMQPDIVVIVVTGYASLDTALPALNKGASAYIRKPLDIDQVLVTIRETLEKQRLIVENRRLYQAVQQELRERVLAEKETERVQAQLFQSQKFVPLLYS